MAADAFVYFYAVNLAHENGAYFSFVWLCGLISVANYYYKNIESLIVDYNGQEKEQTKGNAETSQPSCGDCEEQEQCGLHEATQ